MLFLTTRFIFQWPAIIMLVACTNSASGDISGSDNWGTAHRVAQFENLYIAGQLTGESVDIAVEKGVTTIVNLRDPSELRWDEEAYVNQIGLEYLSFPVSRRGDSFDAETLSKISDAIEDRADQIILLHCASGNRVSGWLAIHLVNRRLFEMADALEVAQGVGMTSENTKKRVESFLRDKVNSQ